MTHLRWNDDLNMMEKATVYASPELLARAGSGRLMQKLREISGDIPLSEEDVIKFGTADMIAAQRAQRLVTLRCNCGNEFGAIYVGLDGHPVSETLNEHAVIEPDWNSKVRDAKKSGVQRVDPYLSANYVVLTKELTTYLTGECPDHKMQRATVADAVAKASLARTGAKNVSLIFESW